MDSSNLDWFTPKGNLCCCRKSLGFFLTRPVALSPLLSIPLTWDFSLPLWGASVSISPGFDLEHCPTGDDASGAYLPHKQSVDVYLELVTWHCSWMSEATSSIADLAPPPTPILPPTHLWTHTHHFYSLSLSFPVKLGSWSLFLSRSSWKKTSQILEIKNVSVALGPTQRSVGPPGLKMEVKWKWELQVWLPKVESGRCFSMYGKRLERVE